MTTTNSERGHVAPVTPCSASFRVCWRNPGHWDIYTDDGRWKIRGDDGNFRVQDEGARPYPVWDGFATVGAAMAFICAKLMREITPSVMGKYVTAKLKGVIYPLQGWVISESPLRIKCSDGAEYDCEEVPAVVINPPERTSESLPNKLLSEP